MIGIKHLEHLKRLKNQEDLMIQTGEHQCQQRDRDSGQAQEDLSVTTKTNILFLRLLIIRLNKDKDHFKARRKN